jgi:hypothetical protein
LLAVDLLALFESLVLPLEPPSGTNLSAIPIPDSQAHRLAKDANGSPCVLLRQPRGAARPASIHLENLSISYDVPCNITHPTGDREQGNFTIIKCSNSDPKLFPHFLRIISPIVAALGPNPTSAAVRRAILGLVELFRALTAPTQRSIQGIWGELFVIHNAGDPITVAAAWHRIPEEHYDFAAGPQRLDVKTSSNRRREHYFSHTQLSGPGPSRVIIASLFVERIGGGISLRRLFEQTRQLLADDAVLLTQFDASFYATVGSAWNDAMDESFDSELAEESLAFFDASSVPKVRTPIPPGVSDVRFCSDLSAATPLKPDDLRSFGNLLGVITR